MAKEIDNNGWWKIKDNPLSKEGVFPYLGKQISDSLEPNQIYYVYRPASEITNPETVESFNGVPLIDEHEMIGEGFTSYDDRPAGGVVFNTKPDDGRLLGDIKIFSENLKEEIESGKKELSMGYLCNYVPERGVFNGQTYDFIQKDLRGNHVALVKNGRMGSDVRVYDKQITFDSIEEIREMVKETKDAESDKREAIRQVMAIANKPDSDFEGGAKEKEETIAKILEKSEYSKSEAGSANDENMDDKPKEEAKDACSKDMDEDKKGEDEDDKENAKKEDKKESAMDALPALLKMIAERDELVKKVSPLVGAFDHAVMSADDVAKYAVKKLHIACDSGEEKSVLKGYLMANKADKQMYAIDAAPVSTGMDKSIAKYLGE